MDRKTRLPALLHVVLRGVAAQGDPATTRCSPGPDQLRIKSSPLPSPRSMSLTTTSYSSEAAWYPRSGWWPSRPALAPAGLSQPSYPVAASSSVATGRRPIGLGDAADSSGAWTSSVARSPALLRERRLLDFYRCEARRSAVGLHDRAADRRLELDRTGCMGERRRPAVSARRHRTGAGGRSGH